MRNISCNPLGDSARFGFTERMVHLSLLVGAAMNVAAALTNLFFGFSFVIDIAFTCFWILCYYLSRFRGRFNIASTAFVCILVFTLIPYIWLSSNGIFSAVPYYSIIFIAVIGIVLKGCRRIILAASVILVHHLLIIYNAGSLYEALHGRYLSASISLDVMTIAMAILIIVYSNAYEDEKKRSEKYAETISQHYDQMLYYMENLETVIDRLRSERHDFNNHLAVIYGLMQTGEQVKLAGYVSHLVKNTGEYHTIVQIPYPAARAMLNYKLSAAQDEGIEICLSVQIPEHLNLDEFDLAVILGNLLDNAVEACRKLKDGKSYISLSISYKPDYLVIKTENPVNETAVPLTVGKTTKPDEKNHGFGLRNIEYLARKHHGFLKTSLNNGVFCTDVALLAEMAEPQEVVTG
ncbi:MAG: sensor histidine kinase [Oscillospiraceae bacterium]